MDTKNYDSIINSLLQFVNLEQDFENQKLNELFNKSIQERLDLGEAIVGLQVISQTYNRITLSCKYNNSKFKIGDRLRLHSNGSPQPNQGPFLSCELIEDSGEILIIGLSKNRSDVTLDRFHEYILDRDIIDIRKMIIDPLLSLKDDTLQQKKSKEKLLDIILKKEYANIDPIRNNEILSDREISNLDESQTLAFAHSCATNNFFLVQGPPGSGKTRLLAQIASYLATTGKTIFITAFTHRAVNNALFSVLKNTTFSRVVKIGQETHAPEHEFQEYSISNYESYKDYLLAIDNSNHENANAGIVFGGTIFSLYTSRFRDKRNDIDVIIVDEAGQIPIPLGVLALAIGETCLFFGDHKQLSPIIHLKHEEEWLNRSIFEHLYSDQNGMMLKTTYRMNAIINQFPSAYFYNNNLICSPSIANNSLNIKKIPSLYANIIDPGKPDVFVEIHHNNNSIRSEEEATVISNILMHLIDCGVSSSDIAVIAPYRAQCTLIKNKIREFDDRSEFSELIVVDTVERMQGQERDVIILSLTTSQMTHALNNAEFFFNPNRLNVAITRARVKRIVVGNPSIFQLKSEDLIISQNIKIFNDYYHQSHKILGSFSSEDEIKPFQEVNLDVCNQIDKTKIVRETNDDLTSDLQLKELNNHETIKALGKIGDQKAIEQLFHGYMNKAFETTHFDYAYAICQIDNPVVIEPLIQVFQDESHYIREYAVEALGKFDDPKIIEPLIRALADPEISIQQKSAQLIANIENTKIVEPLISALKDDNRNIRKVAAKALGEIGDVKAIEPLIQTLNDSDNYVRYAAIEALGEIGDITSVTFLIATIDDSDESIRYVVAKSLGKIGDIRAVEPLIQALWIQDKNWGARKTAAEALGKIGDTRAVDPLIQLLWGEDNYTGLQEAAAKALGEIGDIRAVKPLIQLLWGEDNYTGLQEAAAKALGEIGDIRAVKPLIQILINKEWHYDKNLVSEALGKIGDKKTVILLKDLLFRKDKEIEDYVKYALVCVGDLAIESMCNVLNNRNVNIRISAVEILGKIKNRKSVVPLCKCLKDKDWRVRKKTIEALVNIGDKSAIDSLQELKFDNSWNIRCYVVDAINKLR